MPRSIAALAALLAAVVALAVAAGGCSSAADAGAPSDGGIDALIDAVDGDAPDVRFPDAPAPDGKVAPLDCTFARDALNCWRALVGAVDDCLGNPPAPADAVGSASADGTSCTYASSRSVAFALPFDGNADRADRDFTVSIAGKTCLHYVESAATNGFVVDGPPSVGTLTYTAVGNDVTVGCPDGRTFRGDAATIAKLCADAILEGGVPGRHTTGGAIERFALTGGRDWDFACSVSPGDAGVD